MYQIVFIHLVVSLFFTEHAVSKAKSMKKQSVFERLGEEVPTSTTSIQKGNASKTKTKTTTEPEVKLLKKTFDASQKVNKLNL